MAKWCPLIKETVLYLECLECEEKTNCKNGFLINKEKTDILISENIEKK